MSRGGQPCPFHSAFGEGRMERQEEKLGGFGDSFCHLVFDGAVALPGVSLVRRF